MPTASPSEQRHQGREQRTVAPHHDPVPLVHSATNGSHRALGAQQQLDELAHGAVAAAGAGHVVHPRAHVVHRVSGRRRQPGARQHRQIEQIVAHVGDLGVLQPFLAENLLVRAHLRPVALHEEADPQFRGALVRHRRGPRRDQADAQAHALRPDERRAVLDVEALRLAAVGVHQHLAVGEHAVDVEEQQLDRAARASSVAAVVVVRVTQNSSVRHEIVQVQHALDDAFGVDDDERGDLALLHHVERLRGEQRPLDRDGVARHHVGRDQRQDAGVSLMRRRRSPSVMMPGQAAAATTHVMPRPLRDIS